MARQKSSVPFWLQEWLSTVGKGIVILLYSLAAFFSSQLNSTMKELTSAIRAIELRVTRMETIRDQTAPAYDRLIIEFQEMKTSIAEIKSEVKAMAIMVDKKK